MSDADERFVVGRTNVAKLADLLNRTPDNLRKEVRRTLLEAANPLLANARARASWSRRIPGALYLRTSFGGKNAGVRIGVNRTRAPHARPYEGLVARGRDARGGGFRHPVFARSSDGRRARAWVTSPYRPFLAPAVDANREQITSRLFAAVNGVLQRRGY